MEGEGLHALQGGLPNFDELGGDGDGGAPEGAILLPQLRAILRSETSAQRWATMAKRAMNTAMSMKIPMPPLVQDDTESASCKISSTSVMVKKQLLAAIEAPGHVANQTVLAGECMAQRIRRSRGVQWLANPLGVVVGAFEHGHRQL